ncbi:unnamed protein product [Adineta steineri]|uniref:Uncharacterized protein n=1 Tax=Adineta steineri TaxID=433720 RepID=A0A819XUQ0_9BILA|nr:unnamed protein product [Adineta steineri]CAF4147327.1 unnamed protein product [Adineta steineri]
MPIDDQKIDPLETIKFRAIHVQTTLNNFMACGPSAAILLLDCCREYLLPNEAATRGSGGNENHQGLSKINSLRGSYIAFACDAGRTTSDRSANGRNGIFTAHILQHIATPNLTFDQIMNQVCKGVVAESKEKYWPFRVTGLRSDVFLNRQVNIGQSIFANPININTKWKQHGITIAGGDGGGNQLNQFSCPQGICVDDDHQTIYITDPNNDRIVEWKYGAKNGQVVAGGKGERNRSDQLKWPTDVFVDKKNDSLIICDHGNRRVVRWSRQNGTNRETIISDIDCSGLTMDNNGDLYVSDCVKNEVRRWRQEEKEGTIVAGGNGQGEHLNQLNYPTYIFADEDHSVYVSDTYNHRVMKWMKGAKEGIVVAGGKGYANSLTQLSYPTGVIVDHSGNVYVADYGNHRIVRWCEGSREGSIVVGGNREGGKPNQFTRPTDLSFDAQGNLYVVDCWNHRIQKFEIDFS